MNKSFFAIAISAALANAQECSLWLAPSTTSTDQKPLLGVFAGVAYDENEMVGPAETGIPLVDVEKHSEQLFSVLEDFLWPSNYIIGNAWDGKDSKYMLIPGLGSLATTTLPSMVNVDWSSMESSSSREALLFETGQAHPARGAVSEYNNFTLYSTKPIQAGMELFINYGMDDNDNVAKPIQQPKHSLDDYKDADELMDRILRFMEKHDEAMTPEKKANVMDFIMDNVLETAGGERTEELKSILPAQSGKLQAVRDMGGTFVYRNPNLAKTTKWFKKHGRCMDNLVSKPSTIPQAGRGAFVTRAVARNEMIAPAPMLHLPKSELLLENKQQQLLVNYCFGHAESNMLLFPVGSMVSLINHKPGKQANARLQWSKVLKLKDDSFNWLSTAPNVLFKHKRVGIVMEVVATRDIEPGEEVFLDYGSEWTEAWNAHVDEYKSQQEDATKLPTKAVDLQDSYKTEPYKTRVEREENDYPEGIATLCHVETGPDGVPLSQPNGEFGKKLHLCSVQDRIEHDEFGYLYTVLVEELSSSDQPVTVKQVPHSAISLMDKPYQSDMFSTGVFRHWIGLPEMLVPRAWRDQVQQ